MIKCKHDHDKNHTSRIVVYLGLGSNQNDPIKQMNNAVEQLKSLPKTQFLALSSLYQSQAIGPAQDDFINAVAAITTALPAVELLEELQQIEKMAGRLDLDEREYWGPRPLDIDILLYGDTCMNTDRLIIPHPRIAERQFVLKPLLEVVKLVEEPAQADVFSIPNDKAGAQRLLDLMRECPNQRLSKL